LWVAFFALLAANIPKRWALADPFYPFPEWVLFGFNEGSTEPEAESF
jgi:hypothetical protein